MFIASKSASPLNGDALLASKSASPLNGDVLLASKSESPLDGDSLLDGKLRLTLTTLVTGSVSFLHIHALIAVSPFYTFIH